jgi:predicted Zn-dependent protease with MMP-like domain
MHCLGDRHQVCATFGTQFYQGKAIPQLRDICRDVGLTGYGADTRQQLIDRLEAANEKEGFGEFDMGENELYPTPIHIGLYHNMLKHIRRKASDHWSASEELRFQFQIATTLVHELAHAYGNDASEKCIECGGNEPY